VRKNRELAYVKRKNPLQSAQICEFKRKGYLKKESRSASRDHFQVEARGGAQGPNMRRTFKKAPGGGKAY